jgi:intracellular multiplication protein IcmL
MAQKNNKPTATRGKDDELKKTEEIMGDDSHSGPLSHVLRENFDLRRTVAYLKKHVLRVWSVNAVLALGWILCFYAIFGWFPKYRFIATTDNKAICEVNTQKQGVITPATLEDFAKEAAINIYSYDYINYRRILNDALNRYFSAEGRKGFLQSLDKSRNLELVIKGRLIMHSYSTATPQLESEGTDRGNHFWSIQVPLAIEFYVGGTGTPTNVQDFTAEIKVVQEEASALNPKGMAVDSIVLKPSPRRR